jgi:predicted PurR-regulated permease PerM
MTIERRILWAAGCIVLVGLALYWLRGILLPFAAGMAIAYFLDPIVDRLERRKMSRTWATSIVTAAFAVIVVLLIVLVAPIAYSQTLELIDNLPRYAETIAKALEPLIARVRQHMPDEGLPDLSSATGEIGGVLGWIATALGGVIGGGVAFLNLLSLIFITPVVAFYLLRDWDALVAKIDTWLPRKQADTIREQAREIDRTLASFARGQATICLFLAAFYGVSLTAIGLEFGLVIGLLAGLLSFIPFVGSIVGLVGSLVLAYVQFDSWTWIAVTAGIFFVGQAIEGNILQPKLLGDSIGLHPVWVIFALLAGGALFGFLGLLLAVPVAAVVGVLSRFAVSRYMASRFYGSGGEDPPAPETS